jgi:hypothetical protein
MDISYIPMAELLICCCYVILKSDAAPTAGFNRKLGILVAYLAAYGFGVSASAGVFAAYALAAGTQTALLFTVEDPNADDKNHHLCISLKHRWLFSEKICGVPAEFKKKLHSGSELIIIGRGTSFGLFVEKLHLVDQPENQGSLSP